MNEASNPAAANLEPCIDCGKPISKWAASCPNCGCPGQAIVEAALKPRMPEPVKPEVSFGVFLLCFIVMPIVIVAAIIFFGSQLSGR